MYGFNLIFLEYFFYRGAILFTDFLSVDMTSKSHVVICANFKGCMTLSNNISEDEELIFKPPAFNKLLSMFTITICITTYIF